MKTFKKFLEQVTPIPVISPIKFGTYIDPRSEKKRASDRMKGVEGQVGFYDSPWGKMQGGPPKGP
jgi:hypothetical protein